MCDTGNCFITVEFPTKIHDGFRRQTMVKILKDGDYITSAVQGQKLGF